MEDRERFDRVAALFEAARSTQGPEREALLVESKATDPELTAEVRRLLGHHDSNAGPLSDPIVPRSGVSIAPPPLPTTINEYRVIRQIGAGGMGVVYLAEQDKPRREVAIKVIRPGLMTPGSLKRFDVEAAMLGRLRHPGVAQIYEAGGYDDGAGPRPYFAMEYVDGPRLLEHADAKKLGVRERLGLMARVCEAVQHAHQQGVIHRDLKPGNILVDAEGQPKILDFGVARATDAERQTLNTRAGELVGTVGYMSPEQVGDDAAEVDTRTDVHALGVILYELLAGRLPYDVADTSLPTALHRIRHDTPTTLGSIKPALSGDIETICAKAIEKDKARRYQSASGLQADIQRYLNDEPIAARPPSTVYQLGKFAKRNKPLVVAASAALFLLFALLAASTIGVIEVSRQRDEALAAARIATAASDFLNDVMLSLDPRQHGSSTVTLEDFLDGVAQRIETGRVDQEPIVEAMIRANLGAAYSRLGLLDRSREHLERSLSLLETHDAENNIQIADVMGTLGTVLLDSGEIDRAETLYAGALDRIESRTRDKHEPDDVLSYHADALQRLANLRIDQRRLDEAEQLSRRALEYRRLFAQEQPDYLARTLNTLAVTLRLQGDNDGAQEAYEEALAIQREIYPEPRPDTASTINNLALLHLYGGRPEQAQPLLAEVLRIRRAILPADHPQIARTLNSLGGVKKMQGDVEGAIRAYREALDIRRKALGDDHPTVSTTLINLGVALADLNRPEEATAMLEEAIKIRTNAYGEQHARLAAPLGHLGRILTESGQLERAEISLRRAIEIYDLTRDPGYSTTVSTRSLLGRCLARGERFEEAEQLLTNAYETLATIIPRSASEQRSLVRTAGWVCDLYRDWHAASPGEGHDETMREWNVKRLSLDEPTP